MRTTLDIDDDVLAAARSVARARGQSLGRALSDLARVGLAPSSRIRIVPGEFPTFIVPDDAPAITDEMVKAALEDEV